MHSFITRDRYLHISRRFLATTIASHSTCTRCNETLPHSSFSVLKNGQVHSHCKPCRSILQYNYACTKNGFFCRMLHNCKQRNKQTTSIIKSQDEIHLDQLHSQYSKQNGKCFYSHITMRLVPHSDFQASIERVNQKIMYTNSNVVLCCLEFNHRKQWTEYKMTSIPYLVYRPYEVSVILDQLFTTKHHQ